MGDRLTSAAVVVMAGFLSTGVWLLLFAVAIRLCGLADTALAVPVLVAGTVSGSFASGLLLHPVVHLILRPPGE
jgi:hypothetical protein